jgi:polyphosphate glucokinase
LFVICPGYYRGERLAFLLVTNLKIGIDIGGTGIKGAIVDTDKGVLVSDRIRESTPQLSSPQQVGEVVRSVVAELECDGLIGVGFPSVVVDGLVSTANNIDDSWIGANARDLLEDALDRDVVVLNDADAAAIAEWRFGSAHGRNGKVLVLTFGTGIGSGLIVDGVLVPNMELGQLELEGVRPAEQRFSARAREDRGLAWDEWGTDVGRYLEMVMAIINPDLVVFGGGAAKEWDEFAHQLPKDMPILRAELMNNAGIVGAALVASGL